MQQLSSTSFYKCLHLSFPMQNYSAIVIFLIIWYAMLSLGIGDMVSTGVSTGWCCKKKKKKFHLFPFFETSTSMSIVCDTQPNCSVNELFGASFQLSCCPVHLSLIIIGFCSADVVLRLFQLRRKRKVLFRCADADFSLLVKKMRLLYGIVLCSW